MAWLSDWALSMAIAYSNDVRAFAGNLAAESRHEASDEEIVPRLLPWTLSAFLALFLLSWPIVFSLNLWVFNDRGNLLNLDYLRADGLRLGIDTFYSYGLLPVALQHVAFLVFGRGYWPMIGFTAAALLLLAWIWADLFRGLPRSSAWLVALLCVTPMLLWVNPNFPYSLVLLSMLGALALVRRWRLDLALAVATIGCWSVPSLPWALTGLLVLLILVDWSSGGERTVAALARSLAPGIFCYLGVGVALLLLFGWQSVVATALPLQGAAFYAAKGYGWASLREFLSPAHAGLRWYLFTRSGWWMFSTVTLFVLGGASALQMLRARSLDELKCAVVLLAALHGVFVFYATGPQAQHLVYDPLLAGGVLLGLCTLPHGRRRGMLLAMFTVLALLGNSWQARDTWRTWREQRVLPDTAGLYATPAFDTALADILKESRRHSLLLLTYPTGVHHYFPTVHSPKIWFLEVGQLLSADEDRVLAQMVASEVIVTYPVSPYVERNPRMRAYLAMLCPSQPNTFFRIWRRCGGTPTKDQDSARLNGPN